MKKVITYGSFDLFHVGHYNLLKHAKELGDYLIVGVTTEYYDKQRGKLNVVDSLIDRVEHVKDTGFADEIIIEDHVGQKVEDIQKYGVDIFTVGSDWTGKFDYLNQLCKVVYLPRTPMISSTMLRTKEHPIIRIGLIGNGRIAKRYITEAVHVSGINIQCVYNPRRGSAKAFADTYNLYGGYDNWDEFIKNVDAVIIVSPHQTHYEYIRKSLTAGKHVLCEKPMVFGEEKAVDLFKLAKDKRCILMEAIKTAYAPGFVRMLGIARSGIVGTICDVEAAFTRLTDTGLREMQDKEYGGSFTEFASYTLLPIIKLLGVNYKKVEFKTINAENGIDLYTKAYLDYDHAMASVKCGLGVKSEGQLIISGTKGYIVVDAPWWKTNSFTVRFEDPQLEEKQYVKFLGEGLRYELSDFASIINGNGTLQFKLTKEESIALAGLMERFLNYREKDNEEENYEECAVSLE